MKKQEDSFNEVQDSSDWGPKMKKIEDVQNEINLAINRESLLKVQKIGIFARAEKYMKRIGSLVIFIGIAIAFNSCVGGYVASEPSDYEYSRPVQPSPAHIWISGDWNWNNRSQGYVQRSGYWDSPRQGQTYVQGYWQTTPHGKSWSKGHWQKDRYQNSYRHDNDSR